MRPLFTISLPCLDNLAHFLGHTAFLNPFKYLCKIGPVIFRLEHLVPANDWEFAFQIWKSSSLILTRKKLEWVLKRNVTQPTQPQVTRLPQWIDWEQTDQRKPG